MTSPRRIGAETSQTRAAILDSAEKLMLDEGYAALTYRVLAARAGVTGGLVQYYFPTLDDLFLAVLERRSAASLERLRTTLETRADETLRVVWEFSTDETSAALLIEFMALANHRKTIGAAILEVIQRTRAAQLDALRSRWDEYSSPDGLSPEAILFLLHGIPKMMLLEEAVGMSSGHREVRRFVTRRLDAAEPQRKSRRSAPRPEPAAAPRVRRTERRR